MPKSKHRRNGATRPRVPQAPQTGNVNMAALFERMYENKVLEINNLRAQMSGMQMTLAAVLIEAGYANPDLNGLVIGKNTLDRLHNVAGISSSEDGEGNPFISVIWAEGADDADDV